MKHQESVIDNLQHCMSMANTAWKKYQKIYRDYKDDSAFRNELYYKGYEDGLKLALEILCFALADNPLSKQNHL